MAGSDQFEGEITHESVEQRAVEEMDWPQFFASGEDHEQEVEDFVAAYYRVDGPNGPVVWINDGLEEPMPTTMMSFAMEAQSDDFRPLTREQTPFAEVEESG